MGFYTIFELLCREKGVTIVQAREALGISQSTVASWKSRGLTPRYSTAKKIAEYFGVEVDDILTDKEHADAIIDHIRRGLNGDAEESVSTQNDSLFVPAQKFTEAQLDKRIVSSYNSLTYEGKLRATERVEEIAQIPKYQRPQPPSAPPAPTGDTDTTEPQDATEDGTEPPEVE